MLKVFVTSCSRKQGKTYVSTGLAATMQSLGYSTSVYKPIQTSGIDCNGFMQSPDLTFVKTIDPYINTHFSYLFKTDNIPLVAAEIENKYIDIDYIDLEYKKILSTSDCTIIDGDGGLLTPIAPNILNAEMIKKLQVPILIVTDSNQDAINDTLLTIEAAQNRGITVRGVIINNISDDCSKTVLTGISRTIEEYTNVKILGLVSHLQENCIPEDIITAVLNGIDIESVFDVKIEKLDV